MKRSLYRLFLLSLTVFLGIQVLLVIWHPSVSSSKNLLPTGHKPQSNYLRQDDEIICSRFPTGASTAAIWKQLRPTLLQSLHHPKDQRNIHGSWTADLVDLLGSHVLQQSVKGYPEMEILSTVVTKLSRRLQNFVQHEKDYNSSFQLAPPLKIVVFGGSIVEGTGCMKSPIPGGGKLDFESLQECAWPYRLERALNHVLNYVLFPFSTAEPRTFVKVHNLAAGGTNSEAAIPILRYWLSPILEPDGADVIINAYSANDNLPPAFHATFNTTVDSFHLARVLQRNMQFIQEARFSNSHHQYDDNSYENQNCQRFTPISQLPMILYINDYLGNQQESIIGEGQLDQAIQWLVDTEPTMGYVSVAHSIRRWILADTSEDFFSPSWVDRKGRPTVNVHYGMAGHVTTTIGMLYFWLQLLLEYCDEAILLPRDDDSLASTWIYPEDVIKIEIPSKEWVQQQQPQPEIIRPNLTEWDVRKINARPHSSCQQVTAPSTATNKKLTAPCAFAFLAAPLGTHQRQDLLESFLEPFTVERKGWVVQNDFRQGGFQNKLGLVALHKGATMALSVPASCDAARSRIITIHYLKSYGDLWKDSRAEFRAVVAANGGAILHEQIFDLEGFHDQSVSISYFHSLRLASPVPKDGSLWLYMKLTEGQTFKINALMFCRR